MKTSKLTISLVVVAILMTGNLLLSMVNNGKQPKEVIKKESTELKNLTDLNIIKKDFENINENAKINVNKKDNILIVQITQGENENDLKANFINITQYTDWACKNIKSDIKTLDISVLLPKSEIRAVLSMDRLIDNDYFNENYVKERIVENG